MRTPLLALTLLIAFASVGCATAPQTPQERAELTRDARQTLAQFERERPGVYNAYVNSAAGMAVFPSVGKGGYGLGGSYGRGVVFEGGDLVGYCDITAATIGFQLGGQEYSQIIFFADADALADFKRGELAGAAQASAVAISADASTNADYEGGVAVYTIDADGLMYEAAVGGQQFSFRPVSDYTGE